MDSQKRHHNTTYAKYGELFSYLIIDIHTHVLCKKDCGVSGQYIFIQRLQNYSVFDIIELHNLTAKKRNGIILHLVSMHKHIFDMVHLCNTKSDALQQHQSVLKNISKIFRTDGTSHIFWYYFVCIRQFRWVFWSNETENFTSNPLYPSYPEWNTEKIDVWHICVRFVIQWTPWMKYNREKLPSSTKKPLNCGKVHWNPQFWLLWNIIPPHHMTLIDFNCWVNNTRINTQTIQEDGKSKKFISDKQHKKETKTPISREHDREYV